MCAAPAASTTSMTQPRSWASSPLAAGWVSRSCSCCGASGCGLADVELAGHPGALVAVDRAVERVLARLQVDRDRRPAALTDDVTLLVDAALDRDVVLKRRRVVHRDRDLAGLRGERGLV